MQILECVSDLRNKFKQSRINSPNLSCLDKAM